MIEQSEQDPCRLFLALIRAACISGTHVLGSATTGKRRESVQGPGRPLVGWVSAGKQYLLLQPELAFAAAQKLAAEQRRSVPLSQRVLYKRMEQGKWLAQHDAGRSTKKWQIGSARRRVICLRQKDVMGEDVVDGEDE